MSQVGTRTGIGGREGLYCVVLAAVLLFDLGCQKPDAVVPVPERQDGPTWFEEVTQEVGLNFVHDPGPVGEYPMYQIMGSGAAFLDFDNDGLLDIYLLQNGGPQSTAPNRLFRQTSDGKFVDASSDSGLDFAGNCMGVAVGDVNRDGWSDVLVTQYLGLRLFLNTGSGAFREITEESGLDSPLWGMSAAFVDYDRDGWLDLVVVNYMDYGPSVPCTRTGGDRDYCHPKHFAPVAVKLYRNRGSTAEKTSFEDVTLSSGLGRLTAYGLGVYCTDIDGDRWPDIFVSSDSDANRLWINQQDGTFEEQALRRGVAYNNFGQAQANMGIAWGDVDGDGLGDLFVTHLTEERHTLYRQQPRGQFMDGTTAAGLTVPHWNGTGFGTVFRDFDNDGALDLAIVNGRVVRGRTVDSSLAEPWNRYAERNQLFVNDGQGHFRDISLGNSAFCGNSGVYRGLAYGDYDGDGAVDLLVTAVGGPARLFRNVSAPRGHWLSVRAIDPAWSGDAYGAEIRVRAGERQWQAWINPASSYLCSHDPRAHFGLGAASTIDAVEVSWPDGTSESFPGGVADRTMELHRGEGQTQ